MSWYEWFALVALFVCIVSCILHFSKIISMGNPPEYARRSGNVGKAIRYSFTGAMSPRVKESAYLHLPTYMAGIMYHLGTFLAIALFFFFLANISLPGVVYTGAAIFLAISGLSGIAILVKRISKSGLRKLSNPDDYISNLLVTLFQLASALMLVYPEFGKWYFIASGLLMFYFPLGKLKHAVYFFAARYHLGFFYGWRNVWPPKPARK